MDIAIWVRGFERAIHLSALDLQRGEIDDMYVYVVTEDGIWKDKDGRLIEAARRKLPNVDWQIIEAPSLSAAVAEYSIRRFHGHICPKEKEENCENTNERLVADSPGRYAIHLQTRF